MAFRRKQSEEAKKKTKLRLLKEKRDTIKMALRCARSDCDHPATIIASIEQDEETILMLQERVNRNKDRISNADANKHRLLQELTTINKEVKLEENSVKVRALKNLVLSMKDLKDMEALGYDENQIEAIKNKIAMQ